MASKEAGKLVLGDVWNDGKHRFRVVGIQAGPTPSTVRVASKNLTTNGVVTTDFYRVNRVEVVVEG